MIGSNASLPIVGGSILNHEHYQGGKHLMPMHHAPIKTTLQSKKYPLVKVGIVDWYNNVIRLESQDRVQISAFASDIIEGWKEFSCPKCEVLAYTDGVPHNSVAPVCRKTPNGYVFDLILRNNRTNQTYPDGIFHAHPEYHNIKKEGIGLIEAMGLFILPGRLKKQIGMMAEILCGEKEFDYQGLSDKENYLFVHKDMIKDMVEQGLSATVEDAEKRIIDRINLVCKNILINTAVFKNDSVGNNGLKQFLATVGIE